MSDKNKDKKKADDAFEQEQIIHKEEAPPTGKKK